MRSETDTRRVLTDAQAEQLADRRVMARLAVDPAYRNAQSSEAQARRGNVIEDEVWAEIERDYRPAR